MAHSDVSIEQVESAGSSPASSNAEEGSLGPDYDMNSANATPSSLFTGLADEKQHSTSTSPNHVATRPSAPPTQRALPHRDVSEESIVDAYAAFILYCNPYFPLDIDTSDLKRIFQTPPRSDGKEFSIFTLWELIKRLDSKEIKTWTQLALELGVEPPTAERGGSVQKVQQYSVRLKVCDDRIEFEGVSAHISSSAGCVQCMSMPFSSISLERSILTTWIYLLRTIRILLEAEMVCLQTKTLQSELWILHSVPKEVGRETKHQRRILFPRRSLCLQRHSLTKAELCMRSHRPLILLLQSP